MPIRRFRRQYEQLSQFERGRIIAMMEAGWSARQVARQLGRSYCVVRRCWDQWIREMSFIRRPCSGRPRQTSRREDHHIIRNAHVQPTASSAAIQAQWCRVRGNRTAVELNQVAFSDESRVYFSSDDNRVRVSRPHGERFNPAFALQRHAAPTTGVMVCGVFPYNTRSSLILIRGTMTAQRYVHDILQPHVLPLMLRLSGAIFKQGNAQPYTARMSQDCLHTVTILPWSARSPDLSPIKHIWDHLGRRVGHRTRLNELEANLQQIWNEMYQDIIQNLYASMPDRIVSCIRARGGSTGY
ncbi:transposable element Tcb2 transposase [Trichonephila clavipes]|uniref:Transposable element Tcb2 transposase n=1 Tax=Trichonephila clavipes TaxID=2585209 RepID=A0A8X6SP38_TRICX|nr:transposable element Tcb2 transposase [Trichonephila clavipes]